MGNQDVLVLMELLGIQEQLVNQEHQAHLEMMGCLEDKETVEHLECQVPQVALEIGGNQDKMDKMVCQVVMDSLVSQVEMDFQV